jgi:hypothetical protein
VSTSVSQDQVTKLKEMPLPCVKGLVGSAGKWRDQTTVRRYVLVLLRADNLSHNEQTRSSLSGNPTAGHILKDIYTKIPHNSELLAIPSFYLLKNLQHLDHRSIRSFPKFTEVISVRRIFVSTLELSCTVPRCTIFFDDEYPFTRRYLARSLCLRTLGNRINIIVSEFFL